MVQQPANVPLPAGTPEEMARRLYGHLFDNVKDCLRGTKHILLATDPDFFSVPWNALLTASPPVGHAFQYREAAWLPKTYSLSLLPSARSLYQLRDHLPESRAKDNFLGIGDPDFTGHSNENKQIALAPLFASRGLANRAAIEDLDRLPETADELRIIAKALGNVRSTILLGANATEHELRKQQLSNYRVISFATHALVAGGLDGLTEPALVLTPGKDEHNPKNDGLLTASEIGNLSLDANLVILSACSTAAPDGHSGGRGLSGLADAFFFAGARSLAVTQWPLDSETGTLLGSGLVARSVGVRGVGVAEGLRLTMVNFISNVKEDYLAHPHFWGAFVIAGDGSVQPLDGTAGSADDENPIKLEAEAISPNVGDSDLIGLARTEHSAVAIGILEPPIGEKRAGSYFAQIDAGRDLSVVSRDREMAASGVVSLGDKIGLLGFFPEGHKSPAVFRLLGNGHQELWQHLEKSELWNFPVSIIRTIEGYLLISVEHDLSQSSSASTLVLTVVSESGATIKQQRIPVPLHGGHSSPKNTIVDVAGQLVVAVVGAPLGQPTGRPVMWTNPRTGSKKFCATGTSTILLAINLNSMEVQSQKTLEDEQVASLRKDGEHLYAASNVKANCHLESNFRLAEVGAGFDLKPLFQTSNVNSVGVRDLLVTHEHFIFVGDLRTFLPSALTAEVWSLEKLSNYKGEDALSDSFWDKQEDVGNGFVLVIRKNGTWVADKVFPDQLNRSISNVVSMGSNHFIAVGSAIGNRGWTLEFGLMAYDDRLMDRLVSWLRSSWVSLERMLWNSRPIAPVSRQ
jgi:CHAT domain-containing protein